MGSPLHRTGAWHYLQIDFQVIFNTCVACRSCSWSPPYILLNIFLFCLSFVLLTVTFYSFVVSSLCESILDLRLLLVKSSCRKSYGWTGSNGKSETVVQPSLQSPVSTTTRWIKLWHLMGAPCFELTETWMGWGEHRCYLGLTCSKADRQCLPNIKLL